jgi:putative ABC transport system ATP-binding protein
VGIVIGVGVVEIISMAQIIPGIQPAFSPILFLEAFLVAILWVLIGGIYPAYRASKLSQPRRCAMNNESNIIKIKNLKKGYDHGQTMALNGINLEIKKGEFVSLMGPSGSGKSTLLNMIGALDRADEGSIHVAGYNLMEKRDFSQFRSKEIGFIFQFHNLIPNLTVSENVQIPMLETDVADEEMVKRANKILESLNMGHRIDHLPTKLSGGERQRVAIGRALVNHPSIILADEPTGSLDSKTGDIILKILREIHQKENVTLILVTHEPYVAEMADRKINLMDGKIS